MSQKQKMDQWAFAGTADAYETYLVPVLARWTDHLFELTALKPGERVLDVACGTGIVARRAAQRVGATGKIVGLDADAGMLNVARSVASGIRPAIEWHEANATAMPLLNAAFDVVFCQQGLQFFGDRLAALQEMRRVLVAGGRLALSVWRPIQYSPGYAALADALERYVGTEAAAMLRAPFGLGDPEELRGLVAQAGFHNMHIQIAIHAVRFPSAEELIRREVVSWLAGVTGELQDDIRAALIADVTSALHLYTDDEGVAFPMEAHVAVAHRS
jgi:ubiquinone/menaquinone biosynthesis C-methylase UbiE